MIPLDRLEQISQRFQFLEASMSSGSDGADFAALAKEYADLRPVVEQIDAYMQLLRDLDEAQVMLADPEMAELAQEELPALKAALPQAEAALQIALLPRDAADAKPRQLCSRSHCSSTVSRPASAGDDFGVHWNGPDMEGWGNLPFDFSRAFADGKVWL